MNRHEDEASGLSLSNPGPSDGLDEYRRQMPLSALGAAPAGVQAAAAKRAARVSAHAAPGIDLKEKE